MQQVVGRGNAWTPHEFNRNAWR